MLLYILWLTWGVVFVLYLLRRLISSGFVLCSQGPNSSSSSEGSEEPLVVPLVWFSLLFGLLAETGLPTVQYAIQFKMSNYIYIQINQLRLYEMYILNNFVLQYKHKGNTSMTWWKELERCMK
jgi:hypothetical protein